MNKYATVRIRETNELKEVRISSPLKPEIISSLVDKWQSLIDTAARIVNVPAGLIMRLNEQTIEVFLRSQTKGNPYHAGEKVDLIYALYCETVIGTQNHLLVPDATKSRLWKTNNPDLGIHMISYLGFPINWPDGEVFGTVCLLDNRENNYSKDYEDLIRQVKQHIESDLELLIKNDQLAEYNKQLERLNYTKSRFLSLISHDIRGGIGTIDQFLRLVVMNYDYYDQSELKPILQSIGENTSELYQSLESLLSWSKNDLVQIEPEKLPIKLVDVLENTLMFFEQAIFLKNIQVKKEYCETSELIPADEKMMAAAIRNILSNAIKYTENGGTITIRANRYHGQHIIEIEDTGIGMDQTAVERLFSYNQFHGLSGTKGESSAGIGLMLAKEFLDKNDARIDVSSEVGKGTLIRITI